jgi:2-hydroxychromene-2-carboxylate isomerase
MEPKKLKLYSDYKSPFAYLAFDPAFALQERFAVRVRWIPFQLRIKDRGQRSVYSDYKARYSYLDARRWAKPRGILIRAPQKVYDTSPSLIGGLFADSKGLLLEYSRKAYELFFRREFEADQPGAVAALVTSLGLSAGEYHEYLGGEGARADARAQEEAAADNVFGVPMFFFAREPFWGHDRVAVLEQRLIDAGLSITR